MDKRRRTTVALSFSAAFAFVLAAVAVGYAIYGIIHAWNPTHIALLFVLAVGILGGVIARLYALKALRQPNSDASNPDGHS